LSKCCVNDDNTVVLGGKERKKVPGSLTLLSVSRYFMLDCDFLQRDDRRDWTSKVLVHLPGILTLSTHAFESELDRTRSKAKQNLDNSLRILYISISTLESNADSYVYPLLLTDSNSLFVGDVGVFISTVDIG
jgi:hypothetical protein